jgi:uncharacterized membrane protein YheB (UPF0754 family)
LQPSKDNAMNGWLLAIPFISAVIGWLAGKGMIKMFFHPVKPVNILGVTIQGIFPKRRQAFTEKLCKLLVSGKLFSMEEVAEKIAHPDTLKKIMPLVESHIDNFLRVKLTGSMPMIGMFIGDKTIAQLKTIFIAELEELFPEIIKNYVRSLQEDTNLEKMLVDKLSSFPGNRLELLLLSSMRKEIKWLEIMSGVFGFVVGSLQVIITLFTQ